MLPRTGSWIMCWQNSKQKEQTLRTHKNEQKLNHAEILYIPYELLFFWLPVRWQKTGFEIDYFIVLLARVTRRLSLWTSSTHQRIVREDNELRWLERSRAGYSITNGSMCPNWAIPARQTVEQLKPARTHVFPCPFSVYGFFFRNFRNCSACRDDDQRQ